MLDKILTLIGAGYSKEEIAALLNQQSPGLVGGPASPVPDNDPAAGNDPAPVAPGAADPVPAAVGSGVPDFGTMMAAMQQMGENIVHAIQRAQVGGVQNPYHPNPGADIDAITAQIINPTGGKE